MAFCSPSPFQYRSIEEEIEKYNADIQRRIASGGLHPIVSAEERMAREKAVKRRALDKIKLKRAAARSLKQAALKPSAEEIAAKALMNAERKKASARRHRVKARDALRALRAATGSVRRGRQKGVPGAERRVLTPEEKRARKAVVDRRYVAATREALRGAALHGYDGRTSQVVGRLGGRVKPA
jgi:hypothetical protein